MQQRIERERKELEQGHVRIIKEYESRVRDLDSANRVSRLSAVFALFMTGFLSVLFGRMTCTWCIDVVHLRSIVCATFWCSSVGHIGDL